MGEFGWAYISGSTPLQSAGGVSGSVQFATDVSGLGGSTRFKYKDEVHTLELTGTLKVEGAITASSYHIENITNLDAAGSTKFGNSADDTHIITGSIFVNGQMSASNLFTPGRISASHLVGDGSQLTNLPVATGVTHANSGDNRLVTSVNSTTIQGESNLTWDGSNLQATGSAYVSATLSGSLLYGDGQHIDNLSATKITHGTINNARLPSNISVTTLTGAISAANINAGTLNNARLPSDISVSNVTASLSLSGSTIYGQTGQFSRNLTVLGTLTANQLNVSSTGDTTIGNDANDVHQFTGSVHFAGPVSASTGVSASVLIGDGSQITNLPPYGSPAIATYSSPGQYRLISSVDSDTVQGESNLIWENNNLKVTGSAFVSATISGSQITTGKIGIGTASPDTLLHVKSTAASKPVVKIENQQGGANPVSIQMVRDTNTPADDDAIGQIDFRSKNSSDTEKLYAYITGKSTDVTNGTEDGEIQLYTMQNGVLVPVMTLQSGKVGILTQDPDHHLSVAGDISASVNVSASAFYGDGSNLTNVSSPLIVKEEGSNITTSAASINFVGAFVTASNSGNDVTVTVNAGGGGSGGTIGAAEDASYADGLFTDFTTSTTVGTAVDRFNEVLKILAPSPAPGVQSANANTSAGVTAKLSFGASSPVTDVTSSGTAAGFDAVDRNGTYESETSGSNFRRGVYNNTDIEGTINYDIAASVTNGNYAYREDSFGNGETGTLKLELNGAVVHSINLATFTGAGTPPNGTDDTGVNSNGSGFINVSTTANTIDGNGASWGSIFQYRSADYIIKAADQKRGWNYLRVIHSIGGSDATSNYIEWINDPNPPVLKALRARIENINLIGSRFLSGVEYNTDATANYKVDIHNMYRDVYPASGSPISFTVTNSTTPSSQAVSALGGSDTNTKIISVTGSLNFNRSPDVLLGNSITCNVSATHPLKSNISNTGSATASGWLIDNRTLASDNDTENFHDESFRKTSGSYNAQSDVIAAASMWDSQNHMTGGGAAGHTDGLLFYNQTLRSPLQGGFSANFSSATNGPTGNPNYSTVTGNRTFYRVLTASTGEAFDVRVTTSQVGTTFNNSALGTGNMHMFVKIPGTTGWMDATQNFVEGSIQDGNGALNPTATNTSTVRYLTFGTASVANNDHIMFKLVASSSWTGELNSIEFDPNVSTATNAAALSTIDVDSTGTNAKLSFGSSNSIAGYSNVAGSGLGSMSTVNSNAAYTSSGNRKAIFNSFSAMEGDVNGNSGQFRNAFTGSLILEVNGTETASVDLKTLDAIPSGVGYQANGNGSGFDLAAILYRQGPANANDYRYPYRTGKYKVATGDQRLGWNYVRVIHRVGASDTTTSYGEWVVDTDGTSMASSSAELTNFFHDELYYQSGVGYFAQQPSGSLKYAASNVYRNVYWNGSTGITFPTTTNCSVTNTRAEGSGVTTLNESGASKSLPALNNSTNCEQQELNITGTVQFDNLESIKDSFSSPLFTAYNVSVDSLVKHPFKANLATTTYTKSNFMHYSGSTAGTTNLNTREDFETEVYRIASSSYANQAAVTNSGNAWVSSYSVNDNTYANHEDGLVTVNGYVISPLKIGVDGDTRNTAQGGSLQAPNGNPNYSTSGLTNATRTIYRYFRNETGLSSVTPTITIYGDANLIAKGGAFYTGTLGANKNITVELKVPYDPSFSGGDDTSTAWADCIRPYSAGTQPTADGVGIFNGGGSDLTQTVGSGGRAVSLQLQQSQIRDDQYLVVKISAHKDWTGYISRIDIAY